MARVGIRQDNYRDLQPFQESCRRYPQNAVMEGPDQDTATFTLDGERIDIC